MFLKLDVKVRRYGFENNTSGKSFCCHLEFIFFIRRHISTSYINSARLKVL